MVTGVASFTAFMPDAVVTLKPQVTDATDVFDADKIAYFFDVSTATNGVAIAKTYNVKIDNVVLITVTVVVVMGYVVSMASISSAVMGFVDLAKVSENVIMAAVLIRRAVEPDSLVIATLFPDLTNGRMVTAILFERNRRGLLANVVLVVADVTCLSGNGMAIKHGDGNVAVANVKALTEMTLVAADVSLTLIKDISLDTAILDMAPLTVISDSVVAVVKVFNGNVNLVVVVFCLVHATVILGFFVMGSVDMNNGVNQAIVNLTNENAAVTRSKSMAVKMEED